MRWIWIDRFTEFVSGSHATAIKNITLAEEHLHDLYPAFPIVPHSLIIEAMAQTAGILVGEARNFAEKVILAKIGKATFHRLVRPGETIRFEAPVGQPVRYKTLVFTVRACETTAADEPVQDYSAYILIDSQALPTPGKAAPPARQAFRGWMYARSPGLNPLKHPVYDAWLISCRTTAPATAAARPAKR